MKTYKYKTLKGLISQAAYNTISLNELNSNRIYLKNRGFCNFELNEEEKEKAYKIISKAIYSKNPDSHIYHISTARNYGIFDRLRINKRLFGEYVAGQDYIAEIRTIQSLIRKG